MTTHIDPPGAQASDDAASPSGTGRQRHLEGVLAELRKFTRRVKREWAATLPDITFVESVLLSEIIVRDQPTAVEISADLGIDKSTASRQLAALERRGLIERNDLPGERRAQALSVTDKGREILRQEKRTRLDSIRDRLGDWTDEDVATFEELLRRFNAGALASERRR